MQPFVILATVFVLSPHVNSKVIMLGVCITIPSFSQASDLLDQEIHQIACSYKHIDRFLLPSL